MRKRERKRGRKEGQSANIFKTREEGRGRGGRKCASEGESKGDRKDSVSDGWLHCISDLLVICIPIRYYKACIQQGVLGIDVLSVGLHFT